MTVAFTVNVTEIVGIKVSMTMTMTLSVIVSQAQGRRCKGGYYSHLNCDRDCGSCSSGEDDVAITITVTR